MQGPEKRCQSVPSVCWEQERPGMDRGNQLLQKDGARPQGKRGAPTEEAPSVSLTLHALNVLAGLPAAGLPLGVSRLEEANQSWTEILRSTTNPDGRLDKDSLALQRLKAGTYKLHFDTGAYWQQQGYTSFYPYVEIVFALTEAERSVHIPLLLSPYSYTTYRGS